MILFQAPGWPKTLGRVQKIVTPVPLPTGSDNATPTRGGAQGDRNSPSAQLLSSCIAAAAKALITSAGELDTLDRAVGDGDCGSTLATAAKAIQKVFPIYSSPVCVGQRFSRSIDVFTTLLQYPTAPPPCLLVRIHCGHLIVASSNNDRGIDRGLYVVHRA